MQYHHIKTKKTLLVVAMTTVMTSMLAACGGGGSQPTPPDQGQDNSPTPAPTSKPLGKNALKRSGTSEEFLAYYQQGLTNAFQSTKTVNGNLSEGDATATPTSTAAPTVAGADAGSSGFGVSSTNLIEQGVDEADIAKQNATHIFTIGTEMTESTEATAPPGVQTQRVKVIKAFAKPSTAEVGRYELTDKHSVDGAFLTSNGLITLANKSQPVWYMSDRLAYNNGTIEAQIFDITDPSNITKKQTYTWDGYRKASRRIGDSLYVISSSSIENPWGCALPVVGVGNVATAENVTTRARSVPYCGEPKPLTKAQIKERMPVDINGNKVKPEDCLIPQKYAKDSSYINSNITLVTKVDLSSKAEHKTTCVAASAEHVYMNTQSLYLAGYNYNSNQTAQTLISKFSLASEGNDAVNYKGTGTVDGVINWSVPSFSMNEHDNVLRVVTTARGSKIKNMLHTLQESAEKVELSTLATLPNADNPQPIGKPNEDIQGVRFFGDEGYVVTFLRTDPLYKIDLSNPAQPVIKGELEMPGFSAYLQRINDKYLLGVGYAADKNGRRTGIQTTVFDTSADNPKIVSQQTFSEGRKNQWYSLMLAQDSRAIMTLTSGNTMRIALPVNTQFNNGNRQYIQKSLSIEYEVDLTTGNLSVFQQRMLPKSDAYSSFSFRRALMDGNDIYYNLDNGAINKYVWEKAPITKTFYIADSLAECVGEGITQCMQYKVTESQKNWWFFYGDIIGFDYEEGYEYVLEVEETEIDNPPADAASAETKLVKIISKTKTS